MGLNEVTAIVCGFQSGVVEDVVPLGYEAASIGFE